MSAARRHVIGGPGLAESNHAGLRVLPMGSVSTSYQISLDVADQPGVLATVAGILAEHGVSVETVEQTAAQPASSGVTGEGPSPATATLIIGTHRARESSLAATVADLTTAAVVNSVTSVLRVEGA
ncbi:hypothetical protein GCM10025867_32930 [Frondihabitans sucicola]|uniref:ACT domain-containing protein n=1 Tax=Frondihabitans sucicola TaxID=1268041 RepID=A0ABN6Y119_9MICO|nr:hypothetical protein GCM10025867_32930 [Frondihabitans sucicola]